LERERGEGRQKEESNLVRGVKCPSDNLWTQLLRMGWRDREEKGG